MALILFHALHRHRHRRRHHHHHPSSLLPLPRYHYFAILIFSLAHTSQFNEGSTNFTDAAGWKLIQAQNPPTAL